tara:strand:+ start:478 stop:642 length:165 start_codon:yes stop_codon:yes gene_type:complete
MEYNLEELIAHIRGVHAANAEMILNWDLEGDNKTKAETKFNLCDDLLKLVKADI